MTTPESADDRFAAELRGFGPAGLVAIALIVLTGNIIVGRLFALPVGATLVLLWAWRSRTPWAAIGYVRPQRWWVTIPGAVLFGAALKVIAKAVVLPLLGAPPVNQSYHFLAGNRALLPAAIWAMCAAGFGEETIFRGYLFERLTTLLGEGRGAMTAIVLFTSAWFAIGHWAGQGLPGVEQAAFTGLVFGTIAALTRRVVFLMIAHTAFDLTALAMIYWDVETRVAHLLFT